jgi:nicotinamide-nucleotide amidase
MDNDLNDLSMRLGRRLAASGLALVTAESCTGGWIAKCVTDVAGSSGWLDRGFVTYSNAAKQDVLGVQPGTLSVFGAVSEATAKEMALGALARSAAQVAVAVSGIAGPGGGSILKPVGTVCLAWALPGRLVSTETQVFDGDRESVRRQTVTRAMARLIDLLGGDV